LVKRKISPAHPYSLAALEPFGAHFGDFQRHTYILVPSHGHINRRYIHLNLVPHHDSDCSFYALSPSGRSGEKVVQEKENKPCAEVIEIACTGRATSDFGSEHQVP
jgi:hypothetical protein